jgi:hypothetical protein
MFGHGLPSGALDFCAGAGFELGVDAVLALVGAPDWADDVLLAVPLVVVVDAEALAMPAAAPALARAPATMVAPSIFEMVMGIEPPGMASWGATIVRDARKSQNRDA